MITEIINEERQKPMYKYTFDDVYKYTFDDANEVYLELVKHQARLQGALEMVDSRESTIDAVLEQFTPYHMMTVDGKYLDFYCETPTSLDFAILCDDMWDEFLRSR